LPAYRRLKSGLWQATVRLPSGQRITQTDPLKSVVREWAEQTAVEVRRGTWRDPRTHHTTVGEWYARWRKMRTVEEETARADDGSWRLHLEGRFGHVPLRDLTRVEVKEWVAERQRAGVGPAAIRRALNHLKACLEAAVDAELLDYNVARKVEPPAQHEKLPDFFTRREVERMTKAMRDAGRESDAVMTELMCWVGLRWGEAGALWGTDVDWLRRTISITHVITQAGKDKAYPKTSSSTREVPVPDWVLRKMSALMVGRPADARIFVTRRGGRTLSGSNWRTMFEAAQERAGVTHGSPHTCRHTAASWLLQEGVSLAEVQQLLGHENQRTTERYAHLNPQQRRAITSAWDRLDDRAGTAALRRGRRGAAS
jgi:site-specific recombinase XerD